MYHEYAFTCRQDFVRVERRVVHPDLLNVPHTTITPTLALKELLPSLK